MTETQDSPKRTYEDDALTHHLGEAAKVLLVGGAVVAAVAGLWYGVHHIRNWDEIQTAEAVKKHWYDLADRAANLSDEGKLWMQRTIFNRELVNTKSTDRAEWLPNYPEELRYCISPELQAMLEGGLKGIGEMKYQHRKLGLLDAAHTDGELVGMIAASAAVAAGVGTTAVKLVYSGQQKNAPESTLPAGDVPIFHQGTVNETRQKKLGEG